MNAEYAEPLQPIDSPTLRRTGIDSSPRLAETEVVPAVDELRADVVAWADALQVQLAAWMEELRAEAMTWTEELRTEAVTRAGDAAAQLAVGADAIATLRASLDGVVVSAAAANARTDHDAALVREELASLRSLVEELQLQRAGDVGVAHAAQAEALQAAATARQDRQHLETELARLRSEIEELRRRPEPEDPHPNRKHPKQKKKAKRGPVG